MRERPSPQSFVLWGWSARQLFLLAVAALAPLPWVATSDSVQTTSSGALTTGGAMMTAPAPEEPGGLAGDYYFKGIRLLEVRCEGENVMAALQGEKEDFQPTSGAAAMPSFDTTYRGRLLEPDKAEFANDPLTAENVVKKLGVNPGALPPEQLKVVQDMFPSDSKAVYFERWALLPDGRLQVERALPILSYDPTQEGLKQIEQLRQAVKSRSMGRYLKICGWKLTDPREREAWQALDAQDYKRAAQLFRAVADAQPERPFACLGEVNARIGTKEFDLARKALAQAYSRMTDETRPFLGQYACFINDQIYSYETVAQGKDLIEFLKPFEEKIPLPQNPELTRKSFKAVSPEEFGQIAELVNGIDFWPQVEQSVGLRGRGQLLPLGQKALTLKSRANVPLPNFLKFQILAQLLVLRGHLARKDGNIQWALNNYFFAVRLGQLMKHGALLNHLIGAAMEKAGLRGLDEALEDGVFADPALVNALRTLVDYLYKEEPRTSAMELMCLEAPPTALSSNSFFEIMMGASAGIPNYLEARARVRENITRLTLLKCGADLKAIQLRGPFPTGLDADALPEDPFTTAPATQVATKARYMPRGQEAYFFSLGPAQQELAAPVPYDPTNGAISPGYVVQGVR